MRLAFTLFSILHNESRGGTPMEIAITEFDGPSAPGANDDVVVLLLQFHGFCVVPRVAEKRRKISKMIFFSKVGKKRNNLINNKPT